MKLSPAEMGIRLMITAFLPMLKFDSRAAGMARGRQMLKRICQQDFGYDLLAWHNYLLRTNLGGYNSSNFHLKVPKAIAAALVDPVWLQCVAAAESESLHEGFLSPTKKWDEMSLEAFDAADKQWANMARECPRCKDVFKSVRNRGQCPNCGYVFYASHPLDGSKVWWIVDPK